MSIANPPIPTSKPTSGNKLAALDMLGGSFLSGGMPSLKGGDAGPAISEATSGHNSIGMNNTFSVAGSGGSTADASSTAKTSQDMNLILVGVVVLAVLVLGRRK